MDPQLRIRRKVARYAAKRSKKKKDSSSSSSGSKESSVGTSEEGEDALDQSKIRLLHRHGPGLLTNIGLRRMQSAMTEVEGVWSNDTSTLRPICLRYVRTQIAGRLTGAPLKEALTLGSSLDLCIQGRIAEGTDYMMQRLKALERISQGNSWQSSEKLELAPGSYGGKGGNSSKGGDKGKNNAKGKGKRAKGPEGQKSS